MPIIYRGQAANFRRLKAPILASALGLCGLIPGARAQDVTSQREDLDQRRRAEEQIRKAAEEAKKTSLKEPVEEVTYQDVMKDPDNIELNFRYARNLVAKGELLKSAGTLERILMVNPELPRVRLFYASVLFRLDNLEDADRELKTLKKQQLTDTMRAELDDYVDQIRRRRRKTHVSLSLGAGFDFDENRNSAPASGKRLLADVSTVLDEASTRRNDTSPTMNAGLDLSHDLGYQAGHAVFASLSYFRSEQNRLRTLNLQSYNWSAGGTFKSPAVDVTLIMAFGHLVLAETTYQRSHGPTLRLDKKLGESLSVFGTAGHQRQDYARTRVVPTADQKTGDQLFGGGGFNASFSRGLSLSGSFTHTFQGAREAFNTYRREAWNLALTKVLAKGRFTQLSFSPQLDFYDAAELALSRKIRQDHTYRCRLTYGTPLGFVAAPLNDVLATFSYEYFHALSNLPNNAYTNNKLSSGLSYRLNF